MSSQGPTLPGTASGWTTSANAKSDTDAGASATVNIGGSSSETVKLILTNFGFTVPTGATVTGIELDIGYLGIAHPQPSSGVAYLNVYGTKDAGSTYGASPIQTTLNREVDVSQNSGGSSSLFGLTLSAADVNSSNFGFGVTISNDGTFPITTGTTYYVDYGKATVFYTAPATSVAALASMARTPGQAVRN